MKLIGRTTQLELLGTLLGHTLSGNGQVALVTGPVGTGKTELVHTFAEIASATGMRHHTATCTPSEQGLPLGVLSQLLPVSPGRASLDPVQLHNLSTQLIASSEPLLITVDDIQHADPLSLDCLFYVARRVSGTRVLLLLTEADGPAYVHTPLSRERHCHRLRVASFNLPETALLAGTRAAEVHHLTGGNPLLVHAVLDAASLREDLLACVHRSHPSVRTLALALAALTNSDPANPDRASSDLVSDLSGLDPAAVPRVLATMEASGLVLDGSFRHPATTGYLLDSLPRHERGDLHLRAARLLHDRGTPASSVAPHLLSADRPLAAWAAPVLSEAADVALQDGAASSAARYLELATRTATDDAGRASARSRLASVEWHDCPLTAARHVPALMAASRSGLLDPLQELSLVRLLLWHGRTADASTVLDRIANTSAKLDRVAGTSAGLGWITDDSAGLDRVAGTSTAPSRVPSTGLLRSWLYCHLPGHACAHLPGHTRAHLPGHARAMAAHHTHDSNRVPPISILGSGSDIAGLPAAPTPGGPPPDQPTPDQPIPGASTPSAPTPDASTPSPPIPSASTPSAPTPSAPTPSAPTPSAPTPSAPTPSPPIPSAPIPSAPIPSAPIPSAPIPGGPSGRESEPWARAATALEAVLRGSRDVTIAEELLQATRATSVSDYPITALTALVYAGALDTAADWCSRLLDINHRSTTLRAMLLSVQAEISLRKGDLTSATTQSANALTTMSRQAWGPAIGHPLGTALLAATRAGDHHEAAQLAEIPTPQAMHETRAGVHYTFARGHHHLAANRNHAALSDFLVIGETLRNWQMQDIVQWRAGAAEAWLNQGNKAQARALLTTPRNGHELRLRAACEEKRHRPALLLEAATNQQDQYELARTLEDLSRAWQAVGEHRRARMTARRAAHLTQKTSTPHELSEAERKVAKLAAQGHTNREIADRLFITASTVEQHLTRVYRKLNVKYRTDLPADVAG
ncbi:LuxR C-terminal-related transcriptional regulator [Lentzea sp. NPDC005914]|uniref:helix-turn-helix transcriptional regulator n=1 Tax=Lentzea sp. NPDC005914 TaxID=3154572 RepID=UPI00340D133C